MSAATALVLVALNANNLLACQCSRARYAGDLREGAREGKGILKLRGGAEYDGSWVKGRMHGYGVYSWPDARIYKGFWEEGLRHGDGTMSFPSGERSGFWRCVCRTTSTQINWRRIVAGGGEAGRGSDTGSTA